MLHNLRIAAIAASALLFTQLSPAFATEAGWALLREGAQVLLVNRSNGPGADIPIAADTSVCTRQNGLSERGRQQARRMGALFYARAATIEHVLSSENCSALETAELAFRDNKIEKFEALNALTPNSEMMPEHLAAIRDQVTNFSGTGNLIMVTHPDVIFQMTGVTPRDSEAIILRRSGDNLTPAARIIFN